MKKRFIIRPEFLAKYPELEWLQYGMIEIEPERMGEIQIAEEEIIAIAKKCDAFYEHLQDAEKERLYDEIENFIAPPLSNLICSLCFHMGECIEA